MGDVHIKQLIGKTTLADQLLFSMVPQDSFTLERRKRSLLHCLMVLQRIMHDEEGGQKNEESCEAYSR